jgi:DNA-directed RNA polymerase subunit RPC12/RpoP
MKAIVQLTSRITLEIEEQKEMETLHKAIALTAHPRKCSHCGNEEGLYFVTNKDKEANVYVNLKCPKCGGRAKLGQYKAGGFFWHEDFEIYRPSKSVGPEDWENIEKGVSKK